MKRILVMALVLATAFTGTALAGQAAKNTGCGLGTVLWDGRADDSVLFQVLQATTNGTSGNQTFGITSGTLGCEQPANIAASERLMEFAAANLDNLARDIAMGEGENLETLAELMGVPEGQRATFNARLQANFDQIFSDGDVQTATVLDRIVLAAI